MSVTKETGRFHHGFLIVLACCAMSLTTSITWNTAGIFFVPIVNELGMLRGSLALYLSIVSFTTMLFLPIAGQLLYRFNVRKLLSLFVIMNAVTIAAMSACTNVYHFYIAAVFLGMPQAFFLYIASLTLINNWFDKRAGFFTGLCMSFTGIGAILFNPLGGYIIATLGWRAAYLAFGAILVILVLPPVALFIRKHPSDMGLRPYGYAESTAAKVEKGLRDTGVPISVAVKTPAFFILLLFLGAIALYTDMNVYYPDYATSLGNGVAIASTIGSASMFGSMTGKILLGLINDKSTVIAILFAGLTGLSGVALLTYVGPHNPVFLLVGAFLYGIGHATAIVQSPILTKKIFGTRYFSQVYSVVMMIYSFASAVGQSLWGFIADANGGSYEIPLLMIMGLAVSFTIFGISAYILRKNVPQKDTSVSLSAIT
ncbi:Major facilitator superfamily MFS_1 [uncultured Sporomusa sp.]|uniref:Major facilitator superfamily MFS_1 n=2 Tax=uncultured Sporomusa sp. TaxID=307249 RepID=A0A212LWS9_9FIRM|nr:Major facilitator superfamily MFS_1 [uncultured Sporomusa sp.]